MPTVHSLRHRKRSKCGKFRER